MAYRFQLGFLAFANMPIPEGSAFAGEKHMRDLFGEPCEDEHYAANGDSQQKTANGSAQVTLRGYLRSVTTTKMLMMKSSVASKGACTCVYFEEA
jgi:hypothetical protein